MKALPIDTKLSQHIERPAATSPVALPSPLNLASALATFQAAVNQGQATHPLRLASTLAAIHAAVTKARQHIRYGLRAPWQPFKRQWPEPDNTFITACEQTGWQPSSRRRLRPDNTSITACGHPGGHSVSNGLYQIRHPLQLTSTPLAFQAATVHTR